MSFGELLGRRGLVLRADLLTPWARWITPEVSPRRFDTWFFAAALPPGQTATAAPEGHADPGESESGTWLRPAAALAAARAGQITLLPPTAVTLGELAGHHDVAGILARRLVITPRLPKVIVEDGQVWLAMPQPRTPAEERPVTGERTGGARRASTGSARPRATCLLAPNPSPMTLDGTNTWLIAEPGSASVVVVDPGPDDEGHLRRVHAEAVAGDRRVAKILLTHGHPDHSAGAARLAELTGAPVQAADPAHRLGAGRARRRRRGHGGRLRAAGGGGAGPLRRLGVPAAARGRRPVHRRHGARPRYHGHRRRREPR